MNAPLVATLVLAGPLGFLGLAAGGVAVGAPSDAVVTLMCIGAMLGMPLSWGR